MKKIYLLPNLFTTGNLLCGVTSMAMTARGDFFTASWLILAAMFFDLMDGLIARLTRATSSFGVQYDSLCDLVSFGLAPSLMIYFLALIDLGRVGIAVVFVYAACSALRLARFNSQFNTKEKRSFTGMPTPAAAGLLASLVLFLKEYGLMDLIRFVPGVMVLISALMVSTIRYPSFKSLNFKVRQPFFYLVCAILAFFTAVFHTELFLLGGFVGYLVLGLAMHGRLLFQLKREKVEEKILY